LNLQADSENKGLQVVYADQGYVGLQRLTVPVRIVRQKPKPEGRSARNPLFQVGAKRWVVERSFGWLTPYRRLNREYEKTTTSADAMIQLAFINLLAARLTSKT
jgi:transposase